MSQKAPLTSLHRILLVSVVANIFEWYEFTLIGFTAVILGRTFFDLTNPISALLIGFLGFSVGFIVRPLGALLLGLYADRKGSAKGLFAALLMTSVGTFGIGILPSHEHFGIWAPLSFFLLRIVQGLGAGADFPLAVAYGYANAENKKKAPFYSSSPMLGFVVSIFFTTAVVAVVKGLMTANAFDLWGWRILFLLGLPIGVFVYFLRRPMLRVPAPPKPEDHPVMGQKKLWRTIGKVVLINTGSVLAFYSTFFFLPAIFSAENPSGASIYRFFSMVGLVVVGITTLGLAIPAWRWSARGGAVLGLALYLLTTCLSYWVLFPLGGDWGIGLGFVLLSLSMGIIYAHGLVYQARLFPAKYRSMGLGLGNMLPASYIGGTAPFVFTFVYQTTGTLAWSPVYVILCGTLGFVGYFLKR